MKKALIIEDNDELVELLCEPIRQLGFTNIDRAADGATGVKLAVAGGYTVIILDILLPELDGIEVCKQIREKDKNVPILVLSALADEVNVALLLELGADDYIVKPFRELELKARIKTILRRRNLGNSEYEILVFDDLKIDLVRRKVELAGEPVDLTAREFDLLALLASNPAKPFTRDELNEQLYGHPVTGYDHSVTSHINRIRTKLEPDPANPKYLLTVRGVGYCFAEL